MTTYEEEIDLQLVQVIIVVLLVLLALVVLVLVSSRGRWLQWLQSAVNGDPCKSQSSRLIQYLAFPPVQTIRTAAENIALSDQQLCQLLEKDILQYDRLLECSPPSRSNPDRLDLLYRSATLRHHRYKLLKQKSDLDKTITFLTQAVLIVHSSHHRDVVHMFHTLSYLLCSRFVHFRQPEDVRSALQYLRFLRINHPLEEFSVRGGCATACLVVALSENLILGFGETM